MEPGAILFHPRRKARDCGKTKPAVPTLHRDGCLNVEFAAVTMHRDDLQGLVDKHAALTAGVDETPKAFLVHPPIALRNDQLREPLADCLVAGPTEQPLRH